MEFKPVSADNSEGLLEFYEKCLEAGDVVAPLSSSLPIEVRHKLWSDVVAIMYSSGSTGIPKPIPLTRTLIETNARQVSDILQLRSDDVHMGAMSQCYTAGYYNSFMLPKVLGQRYVSAPVASALNIRKFVEQIRRDKPTVLWVNPTVIKLLMKTAEKGDLKSLRFMVSCTAPLNEDDALAAEKKFGCPVLQSYGLTETLIVSVEEPGRKVYSAGRPIPGVTIEDGVIVVNGFRTNDLGEIKDGLLYVTGRTSNVINVGGVKVSAEQLEEVLTSFPSITRAAALPYKEKPVALIVSAGPVNDEQVLEACAKRLGPKARPAALIRVDDIKLTSSGKIDRIAALKQLREGKANV